MIHTIQTTARICQLPAIPTHDWIPLAARALAHFSPEGQTAVILGHIDEQQGSLRPISTSVSGTHLSISDPQRADTDPSQHAYTIQDTLDRMKTLGFELPRGALQRGLVTPLSLLHPNWKQTTIGSLFADHPSNRHQSTSPRSPIIAVVPINIEQPGLVLICIFRTAYESSDLNRLRQQEQNGWNAHGTDKYVNIIAELMPILNMKSNIALSHVLNPKAWLTDREQEILRGLIEGQSVRCIADSLGRSSHTVHDHVKNLHKKLNATSRGELISKALGYQPKDAYCREFFQNPIILTGSSSLAELKATTPISNHRPASL